MTAPILYKSTDADAPVLSGQTGALNALLKAILVDGYGAIAAAGWTRDYFDAGSNTAVYRPAAGPQHYLQCADNGPGAGTYKEARIRGYETMSAYATGTGPFPTVAQQANGLFIRKSATADATARAWKAIADDSTLYLFIVAGDANDLGQPYTFGRFRSWKNADAYESLLTARLTENSALFGVANNPALYSNAIVSAGTQGYIARGYNGVAGAVVSGQWENKGLLTTGLQQVIGSAGPAYPSVIDGGILISPFYISDATLIRGEYRGIWIPCHPKPLLDGDTFTATDGATTRTLEAINIATAGQIFVETSNTWDTV